MIPYMTSYLNAYGGDTSSEGELLSDVIKRQSQMKEEESEERESEINEENQKTRKDENTVYDFLYKRLQQEAEGKPKRKRLTPNVYMIPGPQEPLPGRSHFGDYWPVFPFHNQFSGGLDLDPAISRHIGGDLNIAVPSWGMMDIYGRFFNRIHDTTTKFGYLNYPVNMLDLEKEDFVRLMSDPSLSHNRNAHPRLPLGKLARTYVPINCKPPMCNPYHMNFGFGMEHDYGGNDGVEGDIDVPIPISKGVAYRFPFSGKYYGFRDNITVTYGHNIAPVDPFASLFDYQKHRDPALAIPRARRDVSSSKKVWLNEPAADTYEEHLESGGRVDFANSLNSQRHQQIPYQIAFRRNFAEVPFTEIDLGYDIYQNQMVQNNLAMLWQHMLLNSNYLYEPPLDIYYHEPTYLY
ncbi:unnamed protein product [Cylicocyclus nassatus]|uniref:Uncharacterized protein n=1 Tax=Cylicocyclus nassatus TaxID=53992 RepID=A0AA36HGF9_CYLNA|nr:unnamed protein product [Cylicocyclus nassatus]